MKKTDADFSEIRDQDLLEQLEKTPAFLKAQEKRRMVVLQKKRDEEQEKVVEKERSLAAMKPIRRRRAVIQEVIEFEGPSTEHLRFLPTPLAICGLPYKQLPTTVTEYEKRQGRMSLVVSSGKLMSPEGEWISQPIPWGPKARLIMAHLSTEALKHKSPVVEMGNTLSEFMQDLGFEVRGGPRGTIQPFKDQLRALSACRMTFGAWDGKRSATVEVKPMEKVELWYSDHPDQRSLTANTIKFSDAFYTQLQKHALPIDTRALRAFSNSARKLDLLFWITYRITRLEQKLVLDWKPLKEQFGEGFNRDRAFRAQLVEDLAAIVEVFPKLPVKITERGLEMDPADASILSIPKRP